MTEMTVAVWRGSYWSCQTSHSPSSVPLPASSAVLSPSLCAFHAAPRLSAAECHPHPLPVCFIKPVRDEVKAWRQLFCPVSSFNSGCAPQAAGWSSLFYGAFDISASDTIAPLVTLTQGLRKEGSQLHVAPCVFSPQQRRQNYTQNPLASVKKEELVFNRRPFHLFLLIYVLVTLIRAGILF